MTRNELIVFIEQNLKKRNYNTKLTVDKLCIPIRDLNIDSLLAFSIIVDIEKKVGYQISDEKWSSIKTLNDLLDLFTKK